MMWWLDDSFSMLAGTDETPKSRAIAALEEQLAAQGFNPLTNSRYAVRYVLARHRAADVERSRTNHE